MLLSELISVIITERIDGDDHIRIEGVTADSRAVRPAWLFVAVRGPVSDGHRYIDAAIRAGATAIICEEIPDMRQDGVTYVSVSDSALALGYVASQWYGNPSKKLTLVGVTGTNGKTTVATLLYEATRLHGGKAGLLSTVENRVNDKVYSTSNTTPSPLEINRLLAEMVAEGCTFAAMEVSSHGMVQKRTAGLHFSGGIFTNLTRDHLDYHKTFAAYLEAKKSFFDGLPRNAWALVNADDSHGMVMLQNTAARRFTYAMQRDADYTARAVESRIDGTLMRINNSYDVETHFSGNFNCYNLLAVFGALVIQGAEPLDAAVTLSRLVPVSGRFQTLRSADGVTAIVDYAHTPDAITNVLETIAAVKGDGMVITVTGAGGNRDHGKRPLMGKAAAALSDRLIITADNPRDEDPEDIADDIKAGVPVDTPAQVDIIAERAAAIHAAITEARPGDIVLIAGKGHEDYQEFENHRRIHFDDREHALAALKARGETL